MSKIICDICGTSYADTATQCPICGCVRPAQPQPVPEKNTKEERQSSGYTYVKGGRFSKSNVKKRASGEKTPQKNENGGAKKGAVVLLIAIILIGLIALGAILWAFGVFDTFAPGDGAPATTPVPTEPTLPPEVACEALTVAIKQYTLGQIGDSALVDCRKIPANATDLITFRSENEEVATVDANGKVTAVQNGTTNIIITCGNVTDTCKIVVGDGVFPVELVLSFTTVTFTAVGETKLIYDGPIDAAKITWSSDNEFIASVSNGVVTANAPGPAIITATYMDKTAICEVLCDIEPSGNGGGVTEDGGNSGGIGEDGGNDASETLVICDSYGPLYYTDDTTIDAGEEIKLYLGNQKGTRIVLDWTCNENDYVSVSGNTVKGLKSLKNNYITVSTEYEGKTYRCKIRVR